MFYYMQSKIVQEVIINHANSNTHKCNAMVCMCFLSEFNAVQSLLYFGSLRSVF